MAMCLMTKEQFENELIKNNFLKTDLPGTEGHTLWLYKPSGKHYSIPSIPDGVDGLPDSVLEHYLRAVGALYTEHQGIETAPKHFCVTPKDAVSEIKASLPKPSLVKNTPTTPPAANIPSTVATLETEEQR